MDHVSEILGAIEVIASLFYVAYQVRQNTHQGKLNTIAIESASSEATNSANNYARLKMAESAELSSIYIRGQKDPQCLIEEEALRFRMFIAVGLSNAQLSFESHKSGVNKEWEGISRVALRLLTSPGRILFWENFKSEYTSDFQNEVSNLLSPNSE